MTVGVIVLIWLLGSLCMSGCLVWWVMRRAKEFLPRTIVTRIRQPGSVDHIRVPSGLLIWNPAQPLGPRNGFLGPANATYWLDESGQVHLTFQPLTGAERTVTGPIPENIADDSPHLRRQAKVLHRLVAGYLFLAVAGFLLGYFLAPGAPTQRLLIGLFGSFGGLVAGWTLLLAWRVGSARA